MTLRELMDQAFDETWFCVITPDGKNHYFWVADYIGGHDSVMPELEPLLDREFDEFDLVMDTDPEMGEKVPMVRVAVYKSEEELKEEELEWRREQEATEAKMKKIEAKRLMKEYEAWEKKHRKAKKGRKARKGRK